LLDPSLQRALEQLRATRFAEIRGARLSLSIPVAERLLNELVAAALPPSLPVRDVTVRPRASNTLQVRARVAKLDFLPPVTLTLDIDQQPRLPDTPLGLRLRTVPGLAALAGPLLSQKALPPGIRLEGDRLFVDVAQLLERAGFGDLVPLIERLHLATDEGRLLVEVDARVAP
jgi:hypothetical protein